MIPRNEMPYTYGDLVNSFFQLGDATIAEQLQSRLADYFKVKYVFLLDNARVGLYTILKAYNNPGEVIMSAYNCIVVPEAVTFAGYKPVFVDIESDTLNITLDNIKKKITPDTRVIIATHLFGIPCQIDELQEFGRENGFLVIEDAAPAMGAEFDGQLAGHFGDASVISFHSSKVIAGETGGALLTNDENLAERITEILNKLKIDRNNISLLYKAFVKKAVYHPWVYPVTFWGYKLLKNTSMYEVVLPTIQEPEGFLRLSSRSSCSLILTQINRLEWNLKRRRRIAEIYRDGLSNNDYFKSVRILENSVPSWIQFPIIADNKEGLFKYMMKNNIDLSWTYRYSCAESYHLDDCPNSHKAAKTVLGLPTYPTLTDQQAKRICQIANAYNE